MEVCVTQEKVDSRQCVCDAVPDGEACLIDIALEQLKHIHCVFASTSMCLCLCVCV